jgi:hypothetical protein
MSRASAGFLFGAGVFFLVMMLQLVIYKSYDIDQNDLGRNSRGLTYHQRKRAAAIVIAVLLALAFIFR